MKKVELTPEEVIRRIKDAHFGPIDKTKPYTTTMQNIFRLHKEYSQEEVGTVIGTMKVALEGGLSGNISISSEYFQ